MAECCSYLCLDPQCLRYGSEDSVSSGTVEVLSLS
jgi:hypothetical protein